MGSWGLFHRRSAAKPVRSHYRKQDSLRARFRRGLRIEQFEERALLSIGAWAPVGPAPIDYGQVSNVAPKATSGAYLNQVVGAVTAVAASPTNSNILYIGTANGGIWRTNDATDPNPIWTPLTDNMASLSIGSLAFDPTDASGQTLVAGVARTSEYGRAGGLLTGIMRTTDGGATWTQLDGGGTLDGKDCLGVAARGSTILVAVDNAESGSYSDVGIFRSTNGGATFTQISKNNGAATGLPGGIAYDLAADPTNPNVFYTAVIGADTFGGANGIYKSTNAGATWTKVSTAAVDSYLSSIGPTETHGVKISVGNANQVYVAIVNLMSGQTSLDQLAAVFRSGNGGTSWTRMDLPTTVDSGVTNPLVSYASRPAAGDPFGTLPSGQGTVDFSIDADPTNANIVYVGGFSQLSIGSASAIGAQNYTGVLFRGDASKAAGKQWVSLTDSNIKGPAGGGTAHSSAPHAGSRNMTFDASGRLIEADDGGVYVRTSPLNNTGDWYSLNGNLQVSEEHAVAYDTVSNVAIAAAQDTGLSEETAAGSLTWQQVIEETDGGGETLAVDDASLASQNESIRYFSSEYLNGFTQEVVDANNNVLSTYYPALTVTGTANKSFNQVDGGQYDTPIAINAVNPTRMVIGGATSVFESFNYGNTLTNLSAVGDANAMVYGGYQGTAANADVLWVASDSGVYLRTTAGGVLNKTNYAGGPALDIVVDPTNWNHAYVIDNSHVYYTPDAGQTWSDITGDYTAAAGFQTLAFVPSGKTGTILVAGLQGVYQCQAGQLGSWFKLGADLPNVPVYGLDYDPQDNVLVAGTLGRGAWELEDVRSQIFGVPALVSVSIGGTTYQTGDNPTLTVAPTEITLGFNVNQIIDPASLAGIQIVCAGPDGKFYDPVTNPYDTDDVVIVPGSVSVDPDNANQVIVRFANTLPDGLYQVTLVGQGSDGIHFYYGPDGKEVQPLTNTAGIPVGFSQVTASAGATYWDGVNATWSFDLTLAPQVTAVVPQPVTRNADGVTLSQARNQIQVYFSGAMNPASAQNTSFYQLIVTNNTANTADDVVINPTAAVYDPTAKMVTLTFSGDLATLGTGSFRLRIGDAYETSLANPTGDIITSAITKDVNGNPLSDANDGATSTFANSANLGSFTYTPNPLTGQSWVISGTIGPIPYSLEWPGGQDTPGQRSLPTGATDVAGENNTVGPADVGPDGTIPTYDYNFQTNYGVVNGSVVKNLITSAEEESVREIFSLLTQYFGVQFVETANQGITVAVGDLRAISPTTPTGPGSAAGMASGDASSGSALAIVSNFYNWGNDAFGGSFMQVAMHEILHTLGFGNSFDLAASEIMGSSSPGSPTGDPGNGESQDSAVGGDAAFPDNGDIVSGQNLFRKDSMDIDMYQFQVATEGDFSVETFAQRLENASSLNTALVLYNSSGQAIAANDDYYGTDSYISVHLLPGTYYVGVSASGNSQYDPNVPNSGVGGTTEGPYQLRLNFQPLNNSQLVDARGIALDGDADGVPGGEYNYWFNVQSASPTAAQNHTLIVDKLSPGPTYDGTLAHPFTTISSALTAAAADYSALTTAQIQQGAGIVVRIVGNNFANDNNGDSIQAVAGSQLVDGQTFQISDATQTFTFELDSNNKWNSSNIRVPFTAADSAATVAAAIANAINSVSWIPPGLGQTTTSRKYGGLDANATVTGANLDVVSVNGTTVTINLGSSSLKSTLQDDQAYEIGTNPLGATLSDGKSMDVPKGVTVMIDAGAVFKLRGANIDVGSSTQNIDRSLGAIQVLGTPSNTVYFTSYLNERIGVDTYANATTPSPGDWGGLVFENDYDYADQATDPTRRVLEEEGIFLDYVNHANISYGGGKVTVNGVQAVYDPIHMIDARPTVSFSTITNSADAALSADPNSLLESEFHDSFGESLYTLDYERVGPDIHGNTLVKNSLNALFLRVQTAAGQSLQELGVTARYDDVGTVLAIPQSLVIQGDEGEAVAVTGTCPLTASGNNQIVVPAPTQNSTTQQWVNPFVDRQSFTLSNTYTSVRFEFDVLNNGVASGSVKITLPAFSTTPSANDPNYATWMAACATNIAAAINSAGLGITATTNGATIVLSGANVVVQGLSGQQARIAGGLTIDPGTVVKLYGTRIEVGFGARLTAEGTAASPIVFTSLEDDSYGAGGTFDTTNDAQRQTAAPGDWGGIYFDATSQGSLDYARVYYAGGNVAIEGEFATFAPIDIRQATVRIADSLFQYNTCSTTTDDRNGRGDIEQAAVIYVRFAQPVIVNNVIEDNQNAAATDDADEVAAISVDVNSLNSLNVPDWGRSTGFSNAYSQYDDNYGPLVRGNALANNDLNGMVVRGGTLTTEGIWDDTDIAHIVFDQIEVPNFDTYGGLRLQSSSTASLVVKLMGQNAGFTADGRPLEITDRVGGTLQVLGQPGHPVVLTSLADDTVSAGFDPSGHPMFDTDNNPASVASPGDWAGITLDEYSNDRNVAVINESEPAIGATTDANGTPNTAQPLGELAQNENSGDDTLRLGFEVHGAIAMDRPQDTDVYSFQGYAGTEVWITLDQTTFSLNTVVELIDADGNVLARSDDWRAEDADPNLLTAYFPGNIALPMTSDAWGYNDVYSVNPSDAALRLVLPGPAGQQQTYYVRVYSALDMGDIDAAHVPDKTALNGETFQLSDATNTSATFEFINQGAATPTTPTSGDTAIYYNTTTSTSIVGIQRAIASTIDGYSELTDIDAMHVPSLAALNGETFQITDQYGTTTYQFVDQKNGAKLATGGNATVFYNSNNSFAALQTAIVQAINDNHITIGGFDGTHVPHLGDLDGTTFQITYGNDQTATFEFVNTAVGTKAASGDTAIPFYFNSGNPLDLKNQTVADLPAAMAKAINGVFTLATPEPTAQVTSDGTLLIHGADFLFNAGTTPFTQTGRSYTAVVKPDGTIALYGPKVVLAMGTTPFGQSQVAGTAVACTASVLPDGSVALYGPDVVLNLSTATPTPFSQVGRTSGDYQLQIKLSAAYEHPGSTVQYADISYATDGIQVLGLPQHSPLISDFYDSDGPLPNGTTNPAATPNNTFATAQPVGNLLQSDEGMINVSGYMNGYQDVSWYSFTVDYQNDIERIPGVTTTGSMYPVIIDVDYADGMSRPDTMLWIFDENGNLILSGDVSNIIDDNASALQGTGVANLTQGSFGTGDPWIGPVYLPEGHTYYVAVSSEGALPSGVNTDPTTGLMSTTQTTLRWEPVDSVQRVAEDNVGGQNASGIGAPPTSVLFGGSDPTTLNLAATPFSLGDVVCYVSTGGDLDTVDAYTGAEETNVTAGYGLPDSSSGMLYGDIAMRNDGRLMSITQGNPNVANWNLDAGLERQLDTGVAALPPISDQSDGIVTYQLGGTPDTVAEADQPGGIIMQAMAYLPGMTSGRYVLVVGSDYVTNVSPEMLPYEQNLLYVMQEVDNADGSVAGFVPLNPDPSNAGQQLLTNITPWGQLKTPDGSNVTGLTFGADGNLYAVTDSGGLYMVNNWQNPGFSAVPVATGVSPPEIKSTGSGATLTLIANITDSSGAAVSFAGLTVGPPDITKTDAAGNVSYPYQSLLFAVTSGGDLYALDPTQTDPTKVPQPIFVGGATSISTGVAGATGIAFSTLDYNLWHVTTNRDGSQPADYGHDITATYDKSRLLAPGEPYSALGNTSFWFGLENPSTAISDQPGASNYAATNPSVYNTYNLPGGAYGSLTTQTFDLTNYSASDAPYLYFDYFLDNGNPTDADYYLPDGTPIDFDSARVFVSTDGANWTNLLADPTSSDPATAEGNMADTGRQWVEERISLASFAGQSNVRIRFDFSTAGDMGVGENDYNGAYLQAIDGDQIQDGDTFVLLDSSGNPQPYEFDMGAAYCVPNAAGDAITDGQTFTLMTVNAQGNPVPYKTFEFSHANSLPAGDNNVLIHIESGWTTAEVAEQISAVANGLGLSTEVYENRVSFDGFALGMRLTVPNPPASTGVAAGDLINDGETFTIETRNGGGSLVALKTFEFDKNGSVAAGNQAIAISNGESTADVAAQIAAVVNGLGLKNIDGVPVVAVVDDNRVLLDGAEGIAQSASPAVTAGVDGAGAVTPGAIPVPITAGMSAAEVAQAIAAAIDPTLPVNGSLVDLIHYQTYTDPLTNLPETGPLPYSNSLTGDNGYYTSLVRGIYNANEGFYIDNVMVGFAERGEMITQTPSNAPAAPNTTFNFVDLTKYPSALAGIDSTGYYQLQIRQASDYGSWPDPLTGALDLVQAIDTNDRLDDSYSLTIPSANDIFQGQTFTVSDGVTSVAFQFVDQDVSTGANGDYVPIYFSSNQTGAEVSASVAQAINSLNMAGVFNVSATTNGTSNLVSLFGADEVVGLSAETKVTIPSGADIVNGSTVTVNDGTHTFVLQFVNGNGVTTAGTIPLNYTPADSAKTIAGMIIEGINYYLNAQGATDMTAAVDPLDPRVVVLTGVARIEGLPTSESAVKFSGLGDENQVYDQGQIILNGNKITYCSDYGIVLSDGSGDAATYGTTTDEPQPGPAAPLREVNTQDMVPGPVVENNVIAFNGSGGINIQGDTNTAGESIGSVPFDRIVNNTIYAGGDAYANPNVYMLTYHWGGTWSDANKLYPYDGNTADDFSDGNMCWAAATSDILAWTGWGDVDGMTTAEQMFTYYRDHFTNDGGPLASAVEWWFSGTWTGSGYVGGTGLAQNNVPGAGFYQNTDPTSYIHDQTFGSDASAALPTIDQYLHDGYGISMVIASSNASGNVAHALCVWGITTSKNDPNYYTGIWVADSNTGPAPALEYYKLSYSAADQRWYLVGYTVDSYTNWYIDEVLGLAPMNPSSGPLVHSGIGINVGPNTSPTILNNVIADIGVGIQVDPTSSTTVIGDTAYQGNGTNTVGVNNVTNNTFPIYLQPTDPLFVDAAAGDFYPAEGSRIIDSSLDSLPDRTNMVTVRAPLGIPPSPILAPDRDMFGQLRADDPNVAPPPGQGLNAYKDRGAIDRVDFEGPTAALADPVDNGTTVLGNGVTATDMNPAVNDVTIAMVGATAFPQFVIRLDDAGAGVADDSVTADTVQVFQDGNELVSGLDYFFSYDSTNHTITLLPATGVWAPNHTYTINLTTGIEDAAGNSLQPNNNQDTTSFSITLAGFNFGTAPMYTDTTYTVSATSLPDGARHLVNPNVYLGSSISSTPDAVISSAGNSAEDGVVFQGGNSLISNASGAATIKSIVVTASTTGVLDGWIDWNDDAVWEPSEEITWTDASGTPLPASDLAYGGVIVHAGANTLYFTVPDGLTSSTTFKTFARFRYSTTGLLSDGVTPMQPTGEASDGEVEDYQIEVAPFLASWGDAPDPTYPTLQSSDGAYHLEPASGVPDLYLGNTVTYAPDPVPSPTASSLTSDDGFDFSKVSLIQGQTVTIPFVVHNTTGQQAYLNAWIDFNGDGQWSDSEQIAGTPNSWMTWNFYKVSNGVNYLTFTVPADATLGQTFARFRLSLQGSLLPTGGATDGEVEDYQVTILPPPATIQGNVWNDLNRDGVHQPGESGLAGWTIYLDANGNGQLDPNELSTTTAADGSYDFTNVPPGTYAIREVLQTGYAQYGPTGGFYNNVTASPGESLTGYDFFDRDVTAPTIVSFVKGDGVDPVVDPTHAGVVDFLVQFSKPVLGVDPTDFAVVAPNLTGDSVAGVTFNGTAYIVAVNTGTGDGTLQLDLVNNGSITDLSTNPLAGAATITGPSYTIRKTPPVVLSMTSGATSPTNAATIVFTVTFSESVTGVDASDFAIAAGAPAGASITQVAGSGATYTVTVNTGTGNGVLQLNAIDDNTIVDAAGNFLGGPALGDGNFTGPSYVIDTLPPSVVSIVRAGPSPTTASTVAFTVTFSEPVTGVNAYDFIITAVGPTGTSISTVTGSGATYTVTVKTGTGDGTLRLDVSDNDSIHDLAGNPLGGVGVHNGDYTSGQTYTIDRTPPVVTSILRDDANPTSAASVDFTVTFSEPVSGVAVSDFVITSSGLTGTSVSSLTGSSGSSSYVVTTSTGVGDGTLRLDLSDNDTIYDAAGNVLGGVGLHNGDYLNGQSYTIQKPDPVVTSIVRTDANPTSAATVDFAVTFSEPVTGVDASDFVITAAGPTGTSISSVTGSGASYSVAVATGTGNGTLRLDVSDNDTILDAAGTPLGGVGLHNGDFVSGETYTIDRTRPTDISLSNASVAEHLPADTPVGVLSSSNPQSATYTYTLVPGAGGDDNGSFRIVGDLLETNAVFDYATKNVYDIRVRVTDSLGAYVESQFTVAIVAQAGTASVGDLVWNDLNGNGLQDSGEPGVAGVAVELFCSPSGVEGGASDFSYGQTVTDSNGYYHFNSLLPGLNYYEVFRAPTGYTFTKQNAGSNTAVDSDAGANGATGLFTLSAGAVNNSIDAGLTAPASAYNFALRAGAAGDDVGQSIATDASGNVYVAGSFHGTVDFDPGPGVYNLTSAGGSDAFVAKYTPSGALLWARDMGGSGDDAGTGIALGPNGAVYVAGSFSGTASFPAGANGLSLTSAGGKDVFVAKLDSFGNIVWVRGMGGTGDDVANAIAVAPDGSVCTTGYFQGTANFNPGSGVYNLTAVGPEDVFVSKLDANGNFVWADRMGGTGWSQGTSIGMGIAVAADGSVYTTGSFQGTADFGLGTGGGILVCAGDTDAFVSKLDSAGNFVWARDMGGPNADYGSGIAVAADGSVYTTGGFMGPANFGTFTLNSAGYNRMFVTKLDSAGNFLWADGFGGTGWDLATGITLGADGSVYTTGGFWGTANFNPGAGTYNLTSAGQKDAFVLKLDSSGNFLAARNIASGTGDDCGNGVAVTQSGVIYTTGYFQGTANFDAAGAAYNLTSAGGEDFFLSKFTAPLLPTFAVTGPTSGSYTVGQSVPITWSAANVVAGATISLCYDADTTFNGNEHWIEIDGVAASNNGGTYTWNTSGVAAGTYYLAGYMYGGGTFTFSHLTQAITIQQSGPQPQAFAVTGPTSGTYQAGQTVNIPWTAANVAAGGTISLCYDTDTTFNGNEHWIEIDGVAASNNGGTFAWNTAGVAAGTYYVAGYMYGGGTFTMSHLTQAITIQGQSGAQAFAVTGPTSGTYQAGQTVNIPWTASNVAANGKISLCYDTDTTFNGNEHWIEIDGVAASNNGGTFAWNTTGVAAGTYYVAGYMYGGGTFTMSHLTQAITIQGQSGAQAFAVTGPTSGTYQAGQTVNIPWTASNVAANGKISLCYDTDTTFNGNEHWIEIDGVPASNSGGTFAWNTAGVAAGTYYLAGYMYGGGAFTFSHLTQAITITAAAPQTFAVSLPTPTTYLEGQTVNIPWTAGNVVAGSKISLCYDTDTTFNGNEHWIEIDGVPASNSGGSFAWNTTGVATGTYYLAGYMYDGGSTFTMSHLNQAITIGAALTLATPQEPVPASLPADAVLESQSELTPIVNEAIQRLAGASGSAVLAGVSIQITDLPGMLLGETIGNKILIDRDAAGYGWFIDPTPADNVEFADVLSPYNLVALSGSPAYNRADLLTTVMHEMGHVLGYEHSSSLDLMYPTLPLGDRRFLAGSAVSPVALAAENNYQSAANTNVLDDVLASFNADNNKKDWSWL